MHVPTAIRTHRLLLRPWHPDDASALAPILESNQNHLGPWIPERVSRPAPLPELAERLGRFASDFADEREWRYATLAAEHGLVLGEVGMFPRSANGRVAFPQADRVEIGYWLRADATGRGYVTEGVRALLEVAATLPGIGLAEIRCDARNAPSAAIPRRLGFSLASTIEEPFGAQAQMSSTQVWTLSIQRAGVSMEQRRVHDE